MLKEQAQKQRLSVSHLIRNMLEDTFELVDTVVAGAGDIAKDSAAIAAQVKQDAGKLAASVRGAAEDAGKLATTVREVVRNRRDETPARAGDAGAGGAGAGGAGDEAGDGDLDDDSIPDSDDPVWAVDDDDDAVAAPALAPLGGLDHVLAWNQVVANKDVGCAGCGRAIHRGETGHLGISQNPGTPPTWLCTRCIRRL